MPSILPRPALDETFIQNSDDEPSITSQNGATRNPKVPAQAQKWAHADSSPLAEHYQVTVRCPATPHNTSRSSAAPSEIDRCSARSSDVDATSEPGMGSEGGVSSEAGSSANAVAWRFKVPLKRQGNDPRAELVATISRMKLSTSLTYKGFALPIIDWNSSDPLKYHHFKCTRCKKPVPHHVGIMETSSLHAHTQRCLLRHSQTKDLTDFGVIGSSTWMSEEEVHEYCVLWICENARPFNIVTDKYFRKHLPHCTTISLDVKHMYQAMQIDITAMLADVRGMVLDMFQADNGYDYMGIVLFHQAIEHEAMVIKWFVLECLNFESHTSVALARTVHKVLHKFNIQNWVWGLVADNVSNNAAMVDCLAKLGLKCLTGHKSRLFCMVHIINLAAQAIIAGLRKRQPSAGEDEDDEDEEGDTTKATQANDDDEDEEEEVVDFELPEIGKGSPEEAEANQAGKVMWKIAKFVKKIQYSVEAKTIFKEVCVTHDVEQPHNVWQDMKTRWNLTGDPVEDSDCTFPVIMSTQRDPQLDIPREQRLCDDDQIHIKALLLLFKAFKIVTDVLSRGNVPMLADVIIHFDSLDFTYSKMCEDMSLPLYIRHSANWARLILNKYYGKTDQCALYRLAVFLHPSMCAQYLKMAKWEPEWISMAIELAEDVYTKFYKPTPTLSSADTQAPSTSQFGYLSYMSRMYSRVSTHKDTAPCPVHKFVKGAVILSHDVAANGDPLLLNPLSWWYSQRVAGNEWNGLTQMALDVLSTPVTLGSYSKAGLVKRGCLVTPQMEKGKTKVTAAVKVKATVTAKA
ncbi:hypothetical protein FRC10_002419 [Ceratobasidium sp. 414]|nr:hypothetical protein FRC10_002419 [Ceratobasidium sp. 414]